MCLPDSTYFSIIILSSPNTFLASLLTSFKELKNSLSLKTVRIPLPPPPADAFKSTGNPIFLASLINFESLSLVFSYPGRRGIPSSFTKRLALSLSPMSSIESGSGPTNMIFSSLHFFAKEAFSDKNP